MSIFCCYSVSQSEVGIIENCGAFSHFAEAGIHSAIPCYTSVAGVVSLRVLQLDVQVETKTKDNVFVTFEVSVQYKVHATHISDPSDTSSNFYKAFYTLSDPQHQLRSYVFNNIRAQIPSYTLDDVFTAKEEIAKSLKNDLEAEMNHFGYTIVQTLITDIQPDASVKAAMNAINAAQRQRVAAIDIGEAHKIQVIKTAEADAESKRLSGVGLGEQRKAIVQGLCESIRAFTEVNKHISQQEVLDLLLLNQYFDTLKEIGANSKATTIFVPHTPDAVSGLGQQLRNGMMQAQAANCNPL